MSSSEEPVNQFLLNTVEDIRRLPFGLYPFRIGDHRVLVIKMNREAILAVKLARVFNIYIVPHLEQTGISAGVITAFPDDKDEPRTCTSPLFSDDDMTPILLDVIRQPIFELILLDEFNNEHLSAAVTNRDVARLRLELMLARFTPLILKDIPKHLDAMNTWLLTRTETDDNFAYHMLIDQDITGISTLSEFFAIEKKPGTNEYSTLIREIAGAGQEQDIFMIVRRIFPNAEIYLNPTRTDNKRELADILVISEQNVLIIQAKDSPLTIVTLNRGLERKIKTVEKSVVKGASQLKGALTYLKKSNLLEFIDGKNLVSKDIGNHRAYGLVVTSELFNSEFKKYSAPLLAIQNKHENCCVVLDYSELHEYSMRTSSEKFFFEAIERVFQVGVKNGQFPRLRFSIISE